MMHNDPSGVLSLCDRRVGVTNDSTSSMIKQHQSTLQQYHHLSHHHSDSSRSSSVCSSSLSPKNSPSTALNTTSTSTGTAVPAAIVSNALTDVDPQLAQHVEYELGLSKKNGNGSGTRKNAWGNLSYAELISKAITSSAEQRLTLSEIYDWMIKYVPFFRNKVDRVSSAGWKNSIRHNLSLHNRFKRVQSEGTGKSSWWIINPDEKNPSGTSLSLSTGMKQPRRRLGQGVKASSVSSTATPKRLRTARTTKGSRAIAAVLRLEQQQQQQHQHRTSSVPQVQSSDMSSVSVYESQPWTSQLETDNATNHLYEHDVYSAPVNPSTANSTSNSNARIQSTYSYDDVPANYLGNTSSNNNNNNTSTNNNNGDYSYHHPHHFHPHSHTLYQHHHGSNYDTGSNSGYYHPQQQSVLNDHHSNPCTLSMDVYHPNNSGSYSLSQQLDPNDEHIYLRVHSTSSHSSSASLSPPTTSITTTRGTTKTIPNKNPNLLPASASNYVHPSKSSSSGGYLHPTSNGTLTLYSHHHQHLSQYPPHPDIKTLLHLNPGEDDMDDDDDLSTLVHHHHGMIDDHQQIATFFPNNHNHPLHSHHDPSTSILRTVLKRPIVDVYNQQV